MRIQIKNEVLTRRHSKRGRRALSLVLAYFEHIRPKTIKRKATEDKDGTMKNQRILEQDTVSMKGKKKKKLRRTKETTNVL